MIEYPLTPRFVDWDRAGITPDDLPILIAGWHWAEDWYYYWLEHSDSNKQMLKQVAALLRCLQEIGTLEDLIHDYHSRRNGEPGYEAGVIDMAYALRLEEIETKIPADVLE